MTAVRVQLGFAGDDLTTWKDRIAAALGVSFEVRYSDFFGGDYWSYVREPVRIRIAENFADPVDGDYLVQDRPDLSVYFSAAELSKEQLDALALLGGETLAPDAV